MPKDPMVNTKQTTEIIAKIVQDNLDAKFILDTDAIHFLNSTFSISGPDGLLTLRDELYENERNTVLDLVVSPDFEFLCNMEPLLMAHPFTEDDEKELMRVIGCRNLRARLCFPDSPEYLECDIQPDLIERFIKKLRVTFSFPDRVIGAMHAHLPEALKNCAGVLIRHSGIHWHERAVVFFPMFFPHAPSDPEVLRADLECVLSVMSGPDSPKTIQDRLIDSLNECRKRLDDVETIGEMIKKNTMETLMLQGVRVPAISADTIRKRIGTLRDILSTVYGWVDHPDLPPEQRDLGDYEGKEGIRKIISLLS